jgi:hypothetical protein
LGACLSNAFHIDLRFDHASGFLFPRSFGTWSFFLKFKVPDLRSFLRLGDVDSQAFKSHPAQMLLRRARRTLDSNKNGDPDKRAKFRQEGHEGGLHAKRLKHGEPRRDQ